MKRFRKDIWEEGEYIYPAAYGFLPNIQAYLHDDDEKRDCILILPGGGYCMCCSHEGELPAREFYKRGCNTFVLSYTTDITMSVPLKRQPLEDISRAVRYIRKRADEYGVKRLFICGFSAAGHLCATLAVHFADVEDKNPQYKDVSNRPDGAILSYPVITAGVFTHADSVRALLGDDPSAEELAYYSAEKNVGKDTPPCFIWQTQTDSVVPVENSYMFAEALRKEGIPFAHYVYPSGEHGLSVSTKEMLSGTAEPLENYSMEQTEKAVEAVRKGRGINVSEKRRQELIDQFSAPPMEFPKPDMTLADDVGTWTDLACVWMKRI